MEQSAMNATASRTGRCWTFDARADGYIKAEAINALILKRLDDAVRDADPIRAVIRGTSTNSDGWTPGIANPSSTAQEACIRRAITRAGISSYSDTAFLECHGTGTLAGDPVEVNAAAAVFAQTRQIPLRIGSVKSNIGHSEPAAGISGMLKTILSIETGFIPGNPTFEIPNPGIDFAKLNVLPSQTGVAWPANTLRRASVNSFGYGGSNAHAVVEHPGILLPDFASPHVSSYLRNEVDLFTADNEFGNSKIKLFVFSANDETALRKTTESYIRHLANPAVSVKPVDLAYTLSERRTQHFHRAFSVSKDTKFNESQFVYGKRRSAPPRLGFVFTGQGAQWNQMGKELLEAFPIARSIIKKLDIALGSLQNPPSWSLYDELVQFRTAEHLRSPAYSQPLVTALQLMLLAILADTGLEPVTVVGHSSGEIAAAAAAGRLTYEEAIKVAYLRGRMCVVNGSRRFGMLAVGVGEQDMQAYLRGFSCVKVACINSPRSVTISGELSDLEQLQKNVKTDGHFSRLLHVDMAYHSDHISKIGTKYLQALEEYCPGMGIYKSSSTVKFYSTVYGEQRDCKTDARYWHDNMVRPVQFAKAVERMIVEGSTDFFVELGPSGALVGPISQIKQSLSETFSVEYAPTLVRGNESIRPLFELFGNMFLAGLRLDLKRVNSITATDQPMIITDLPNYAWNHSVKYWHEPLTSLDWRFRKFPIHDLLGTKILGTSWQVPSWRRILRLKELPWLQDHRIGADVIFPASAYIAMATEAMYQTAVANSLISGVNTVTDVAYGLRCVRLLRALVLEDDRDCHIYLFLTPGHGTGRSWHRFSIQVIRDGTWMEHAEGLIQVLHGLKAEKGSSDTLTPMKHPVNARLWYKALKKVGFDFRPAFQHVLEYETHPGAKTGRARISWHQDEDPNKQSTYTIHPTIIDAFFQAGCPSVYRYRTAVDRVILPRIIDEIIIPARPAQTTSAIILTRCTYVGSGRETSIRNHASHAEVYDESTGQVVFRLAGLHYIELDVSMEANIALRYARLSWQPDITFLSDVSLESLAVEVDDSHTFKEALGCSQSGVQLLSLLRHKMGLLSILEIDLRSDGAAGHETPQLSGKTMTPLFSHYTYMSKWGSGCKSARNRMRGYRNCSFFVHDILGDQEAPFKKDFGFNVVIVRISLQATRDLQPLFARATSYASSGFVLLLQSDVSFQDSGPTSASNSFNASCTSTSTELDLYAVGLRVHVRSTQLESASQAILCSTRSRRTQDNENDIDRKCSILNFSENSDATSLHMLSQGLREVGILAEILTAQKACNTPLLRPILLLDDSHSSLLENIDEECWRELKRVLQSGRRILYVSCGSQYSVSSPSGALFIGMARTVRSEDPSITIKTLDVSSLSPTQIIAPVHDILGTFGEPSEHMEYEYCARDGKLYVSRLQEDHTLVEADREEDHGRPVQTKLFHANPRTVRMKCTRIGILDSLSYYELDDHDDDLEGNYIEIELRAASLNYKDVATSMGLVAEDEYRIGSDGAGIVARVGKEVSTYSIGDRVMTLCRGTIANRIQTEPDRCLKIPDLMSFEEAASMPIVYFTVVFALLERTKARKGQSILIHSAAGGVGLACVQLCHYLGLEMYTTVGSKEKRQVLVSRFGIPPDRIFSSRSTEFGPQLMAVTNNRGVDIILNSLTGDLLAESWSCLADNGTLIEIGKKDIVDKGSLSMEPFDRNCTYTAIDIAQPAIYFDFHLIKRVMSTIMYLIENDHIKPIEPRKVFSFAEDRNAVRSMRTGTQFGKIILSDYGKDILVPVEPAPRALLLQKNGAYLLVGGLKGICGSLAIFLAQHGARELIVMSRSKADDDASKAVMENVAAMGVTLKTVQGDVTCSDDVARLFREARGPVRGIVQGAMVLKDKTLETMTCSDFHAATAAKVRGTWNLHLAAQDQSLPLDFFTLLSSISAVVGTGGQANYAAGNAFLDSFAAYRNNMGLCAHSINLGAIEEIGYMSTHNETAERLGIRSKLKSLDERTLHRIVKLSILQQVDTIEKRSRAQMITGLPVPLMPDSGLLEDARFSYLWSMEGSNDVVAVSRDHCETSILQQMLQAKVHPRSIIQEIVSLLNSQLVKNLGLVEDMEPDKSLNSYGIDSLAAVDLRNWLRTRLKAELTTTDILNAKSLTALASRVQDDLQGQARK